MHIGTYGTAYCPSFIRYPSNTDFSRLAICHQRSEEACGVVCGVNMSRRSCTLSPTRLVLARNPPNGDNRTPSCSKQNRGEYIFCTCALTTRVSACLAWLNGSFSSHQPCFELPLQQVIQTWIRIFALLLASPPTTREVLLHPYIAVDDFCASALPLSDSYHSRDLYSVNRSPDNKISRALISSTINSSNFSFGIPDLYHSFGLSRFIESGGRSRICMSH
ncbi:hypothetical protein DFH11DRAFT_712219 [Phellopilus nigrolimitatus]|nr:hypothetical protein DFH11DRAFT_712219 [Phellopilus nigrolimitatus]